MKKFTIDKFIAYTKANPTRWINYCEVLMTADGDIILARPSHAEAAIQYAAELEHRPVDEIKDFLRREMLSPVDFYAGKYRLISIWYDCVVTDSLCGCNDYQIDSFNKLKDVGLICAEQHVMVSREYYNYLVRKMEI